MSCLVSHRAIIYRLQEHTVSKSTNQRGRGMFAQGHFCPRKILPHDLCISKHFTRQPYAHFTVCSIRE